MHLFGYYPLLLALVVNIYAVYKNTYVLTKKARTQKEELKKQGLK